VGGWLLRCGRLFHLYGIWSLRQRGHGSDHQGAARPIQRVRRSWHGHGTVRYAPTNTTLEASPVSVSRLWRQPGPPDRRTAVAPPRIDQAVSSAQGVGQSAEDHPIAAPTPEPIPPNGSPYQPPVREHLAWAAGFLEGDGSFIHAKSTRTMFVSFTQVDREVLDRFRCTVGFGKVYGPYRHRPGQALSVKPFYQLRVHGFEKVQAIAAMLWFKLGAAKRVQASRVLRQWPRECHRGHPLITGHSGCGRCTADYWESWRNGTTAASRPGSDVLKGLK